jgi:hypothetical protein
MGREISRKERLKRCSIDRHGRRLQHRLLEACDVMRGYVISEVDDRPVNYYSIRFAHQLTSTSFHVRPHVHALALLFSHPAINDHESSPSSLSLYTTLTLWSQDHLVPVPIAGEFQEISNSSLLSCCIFPGADPLKIPNRCWSVKR